MIMCLSLAGCKTLGGMTYDTSTSNTATDQSQAQNRIDPSMAISATGDSSSYKGSVHDETSTSTDNNNDAASSTGSKNVLGSLDDKSTNINKTQSSTKNATDDDHYTATSMVINTAESILDKVMRIIDNNVYAIMIMLSFWLGGFVSERRRDKYRAKYEKN